MAKSLTTAALLAIAAADSTTGGTLAITWKDCGDASTHGKVTDLEPKSIEIGSSATMTGTGTVDEDVSGGSFKIDMKASIIKQTWTGDICTAKTFNLPLGMGSVTWQGMKCPISKGTMSVPIGFKMSSAIPASLASADVSASSTATNGDKLLCMTVHLAKEGIVHQDRSAQILEIQNTPGVLWTAAAAPRFASQAPGASKSLCGVKGDWKAAVENAVASGQVERFQLLTAIEAPESFDSEANWPQCAKIIGDIRDQSNCGCCWAFAAAEAASDRMCIATNASKMLPLSAQDVCFGNDYDGCDGGQIGAPWDYISESGAVSGGQYQGSGPFGKGFCSDFSMPHCHHHGPQGDDPYPAEGAPGCPSQRSARAPTSCDSDAQAPHNDFKSDKYTFSGRTQSASGPSAIKQAIMQGGPVETAFTVYSDFENYVSGIYHHVSGSMAGGHAVKIVGWGVEDGTKYWKIANSWNPYWGEKGYFRIREGEGGIDETVTFSAADATWTKKGEAIPSQIVV